MVLFRLRIQYLLTFSLLFTCLAASSARSESLGLDFSLPDATPTQANTAVSESSPLLSHQPLPVPQAARRPPTQNSQSTSLPMAYGGVDGLSLPNSKDNPGEEIAIAQLPPPPPLPASVPTSRVFPPLQSLSSQRALLKQSAPDPGKALSAGQPATSDSDIVAFEIPQRQVNSTPQAQLSPPAAALDLKSQAALSATPDMSWIFEGASDSLVARAIGSAEGTRTPQGQRTRYYRGHTDPGNGVWNLGTFSYQHGASSPEEADAKQLARLKRQGETLKQKAQNAGIALDLVRTLNALDLANQSPAAALNRGGYIDRLVEAESQGLKGSEAILWARINSYRNPDTQQWNAPGLGNTLQGVSRDQQRRLDAIASALASYQQEQLATVSESTPEPHLFSPTLAHEAPPLSTPTHTLNSSLQSTPASTQSSALTADRVEFRLTDQPLPSKAIAQTDSMIKGESAHPTREIPDIHGPGTSASPASSWTDLSSTTLLTEPMPTSISHSLTPATDTESPDTLKEM